MITGLAGVALEFESVVGAVNLAPDGRVTVAVCCSVAACVFSLNMTSMNLSGFASPVVSSSKRNRTLRSKTEKFTASPGTMKPWTVIAMTTLELSLGSRKRNTSPRSAARSMEIRAPSPWSAAWVEGGAVTCSMQERAAMMMATPSLRPSEKPIVPSLCVQQEHAGSGGSRETSS